MLTIKQKYVSSKLSEIFSLLIFCLSFWGIKYTDDWYGYLHFFNNPESSPDILFGLISYFFKYVGYTYVEVFQFHIFLIGIFYIKFISRFTSKTILITILLVLGSYLTIANMIRYHLAFSIFLVSGYSFFYSKKKIFAISLMILSVLAHKAILPLFAILFIYKRISTYSSLQLHKYTLTVGISILIIFNILTHILTGHFQSYLGKTWESSMIGGIYNLVPILLMYLLVCLKHSYYKKKSPKIYEDKKYKFLFVISTFSFVFVFISLQIQIFAHRYIYFFFIVWLIYFIYPLNFLNRTKNKISIIFQTIFVSLLFFIWNYIMPILVLGNRETYIKIIETISSYR